MQSENSVFQELDDRRRRLGLSYDVLARRSGVSRPTVLRILSGRHPTASFSNVQAIAEALGLDLTTTQRKPVADLRREQATTKARKLVALVQGTSGLEGQAVNPEVVSEMLEQTTIELLAGPKRKLWSEE
ncbi:MAG: helix-turn-helix transcriptional regulator [Isosphaeraceae bacterium]